MRVPKYRKQTKTLPNGEKRFKGFVETGGERHYFTGAYKSKESLAEYKTFIRRLLAEEKPGDQVAQLRLHGNPTLALALEKYILASHRARTVSGARTAESYHVDRMAEFLLEFGALHLAEFGPLNLKKLQENLKSAKRLKRCKVDPGDGVKVWTSVETKKLLTVRYINDQVNRVRRFFRWCVAEELIPSAVADALDKVEPVKESRAERLVSRRRKKEVKSLDPSLIKAVLPFLSPTLSTMAQLNQITGMRPTEMCTMRPMHINTSAGDGLWEYYPEYFKGDDDECLEAVVPLGPLAQRLLKPFMEREPFEYIFSPRESLSWYHEQRWKGKGTSKRREPKTYRTIGECFTHDSYRKAIARAAKKAGVPHWFPYQLRHTHGTVVRKKHGLEGAQVALRHKHADVTQIYAERNLALARTIARDMG